MSYGREVFTALLPGTRSAFASFIGVWFAYQLLYKGLFRGELSFQTLLPKLALFFFLHGCLYTADFYWDYVYLPLKETTVSVAQVVVQPATAAGVSDRTIPGLLKIVEDQVGIIIWLAHALISDAGWSAHLVIGALVLMIPYLFVWGVFLAFMLEGVFKLLAMTVLAPLAIVAAAFEPTRGFAVSAGRVLLGGALTVVFAAVAMGFTVAVLRHYVSPEVLPYVQEGNRFVLTKKAEVFVFGKTYFAIFVLGFVSILFHLKASTLASNISGAMDGPGAAAAVVGSGMALLGAAKGAAIGPARRYGGKALGRIDSATAAAPRQLLERFTRR